MDKNFLDTLSKDGNAYLISSAEDLCNLSEYVNAGNDCKDLIFKLANDIDLRSVENFTPIGTQEINHFAGTFDGNGKIISNLKIVGEFFVGLFGCNSGTIKNVNLSDAEVKSNSAGNIDEDENVGSLVGFNHFSGTIKNCTPNGKVEGFMSVGGLIGENSGTVENCAAKSNVKGIISTGGLVGCNTGSIKNCTASSSVSGENAVGGLAGYTASNRYKNHYSTIEKCTSEGLVIGENGVGGLVGDNGVNVIVKDCTANGNVCGTENVGGLVGSNSGKIQNCSASGTVSKRDEII